MFGNEGDVADDSTGPHADREGGQLRYRMAISRGSPAKHEPSPGTPSAQVAANMSVGALTSQHAMRAAAEPADQAWLDSRTGDEREEIRQAAIGDVRQAEKICLALGWTPPGP